MATKLLSIKECKDIYGLSRITLINYEKKGLIKPVRTPGGVRRYRVEVQNSC
jgi:DNA-binding transcriptional MerR regulator